MRRMSDYERSLRWVPYSLFCLAAFAATLAILLCFGMTLGWGLIVFLPFAGLNYVLQNRAKARFDREQRDKVG